MNVMPKDVAAAGFDSTARHEELLALNPWARDLTIEKDNADFAAARQKATLARHAGGQEAWNGWANGMLALEATLQAARQCAVDRETFWLPPGGENNEATRVWRALASAVFSTKDLKHRFETDVSFRSFVFPPGARFDGATFGGKADFASTTFNGRAAFRSATFGAADFRSATFGEADFESATFGRKKVFLHLIGEADFRSATLNGEANFRSATFNGAAGFWSATFNGRAFFWSATFRGGAWFEGATFSGLTYFSEARFNDEAHFVQAKFYEPVIFEKSIFGNSANFDGVDSAATFSLAAARAKFPSK